MLDWLHDCYFAAVGGDSPSFEAWPSNRGKRSRTMTGETILKNSDQSTTSTNTFWPCGDALLGR